MKFRQRIHLEIGKNFDVPAGFKRLGNLMILRSGKQIDPVVGTAALKLYEWCEGVFQHHTTLGESRKPKLRHLAGSSNTEVIHTENGVEYVLDVATITFSGGNSALRRRLVHQVSREENLLDMFAAVGNLSLQPLFYNNNPGVLVEKNPYTFEYLTKTMRRNKLANVQLINSDCRDLSLRNWADRIFMGYHDVDKTYLQTAILAAKSKCQIHLHPLSKDGFSQTETDQYSKWIENLGCGILAIERTKVKNYSPGIIHHEVVYSIEK